MDVSVGVWEYMGSELASAVQRACGGALSKVSWFRTDWQRGGALTGYATFDTGSGEPADVVVKLPARPRERLWLERLQLQESDERPPCVPRLFAHGDAVNGYDLVWLVMERLPHGPLGTAWGGREFDLTIEAIGRFYERCEAYENQHEHREPDWVKVLERARRKVHDRALAEEQRWKQALRGAGRSMDGWLKAWDARERSCWCHGDLHLGNAMSPHPHDHAEYTTPHAVLLDLAEMHSGHWVEDAVYFEHLYWAQRDRLGGRKLCSMLAKQRRQHGLAVCEDWPRLAEIKRALLAMAVPAMLEHDGDRSHVRAALEVLEHAVSHR